MTPALVELLGIVVRVWAIVRVHPWLRASIGPTAEVVGLGLGISLAGLTCSPEALLVHAATILGEPTVDPIEAASSWQAQPASSASLVPLAAIRGVVAREAILGTILGLVFGVVASAWLAVVRAPTLSSELLAGASSPGLSAALATSALLIVFEAGAHHDALASLSEATVLPGAGEGAGLGWPLVDPHVSEVVLGLVSLCVVTVVAFVLSATFPLVAIDATVHATGVAAPAFAPVAEPLAVGVRAASVLLWLVTALSAMPAAWLDAFLAGMGR